jgi:hypothetical protein
LTQKDPLGWLKFTAWGWRLAVKQAKKRSSQAAGSAEYLGTPIAQICVVSVTKSEGIHSRSMFNIALKYNYLSLGISIR